MSVLHFLLQNWDSILVLLIVLAVIIALIAKKQYAILDKIVFVLVTEAEKKYGSGTGSVKFAAVVDWLYPKIPALVRLFVTSSQLEKLIERVLAEAQKKWSSNADLSTYINPIK
jgi:hypothetical protein